MSKQVVGLDIGYGFTKATDGEQIVIFPSVAGDVCEADFDNDLVRAGQGHVIERDGRQWFYGNHAQKHSRNPLALFARERTEQHDLMRLLLCAAMSDLGIEGRLSLCTGLPVDWFGDREALEKLLLGEHVYTVDGEAVGLFDRDICWNRRIDLIEFGPQETDVSYGRTFDAAQSWQTFTRPTPGAPNTPSPKSLLVIY